MRYLFGLIFFLGAIEISYSQIENLIPNPGFEEIDSCPRNRSTEFYHTINFAKYWKEPNDGTVDLLSTCNDSLINSLLVTKRPRTGNAFVGIYLLAEKPLDYTKSPIPCVSFDYKEYIQVKLAKPLVKDRFYSLSFYTASSSIWYLRTGDIGAHFSIAPISYFHNTGRYDINTIIRETPQINHNPKQLLSTDWQLITDVYKAKGGENYLTVGNFTPDTAMYYSNNYFGYTATGVCNRPSNLPFTDRAYYYLDDFTLLPCDSLRSFDYGTDTLYQCSKNEVKTLSPRFYSGKYKWNNGSTDSTVLVTAPGVYKLRLEFSHQECLIKDTILKNYRQMTLQFALVH